MKKIKTLLFLALIMSIAFSTSYLKNISVSNQKDYVIVSFQISGKNIQYSLYPYVDSISINVLFDSTKSTLSTSEIISKFLPLEKIKVSKKDNGTLVKVQTNAKVDYKFDTGSQNGNSFTLNLYLSKNTPLIDVDYTGGKFSTLDSVLKEVSKMIGRNIILSPELSSIKVNLSLKNVRPTDLFTLVLSSAATDIGYTVLKNGSYYVDKISNIIKKYNITLASLALKLSKETDYKIVVDPSVRNKMITYNSEDFSPKTLLKVISLIDGVAYSFVDKNILYISTVDKIEKMFSSSYIIKTYDVPADFDPKSITGILSANAKLIKITDTSVLLKGLSKDHLILKTILSNIKSKKYTYEIIKTSITSETLKALKEVFKNIGLVQIKDKLLLTGDSATINNIKVFLNNFSNDNYIKVVDVKDNAQLISTFVNKYFPEITSTSMKNLVILSGPQKAVEESLSYINKINASLSQVEATAAATNVKTSKIHYDIQVVESSLPPDAVKSIISEFGQIKVLYNNNGKFIVYGNDLQLSTLRTQLLKVQQSFENESETPSSTTSFKNNVVIKEFKISNLNDKILENVKNLINPNLRYFYSNNILIIKSDQTSIDRFMKYIQYFVPNNPIENISSKEKEIIKDFYLGKLNINLVKQILSIYYENLKVDYIPQLNKIILKGKESQVKEAIEKLTSLNEEIKSKSVSEKSTQVTKWIHLNNLNVDQAKKIIDNYSKTTDTVLKSEAVSSTGYIMVSGKSSVVNYLENILLDMDNSMKNSNKTTAKPTQTSEINNIVSTVSASSVKIFVKNYPISDLIYKVSKLLSKDILTENLSGYVSLSISSIDFDDLLNLLQTQNFIKYTKEGNRYLISGKIVANPKENETISTVLVGYNVEDIRNIVSSLFGIDAIADKGSQTLILKGNENKIQEAKKLVNELSNGSNRIDISIKITSQDVTNKESYGNSVSVSTASGDTGSIQNSNSDSQYLGFNIGGNKLEISSSKFRNSSANIISQPNVVTINGKPVKIHIGQSFSKIINQTAGANPTSGTMQNSQSVKQFNTGVILTVTPVILLNGKILLTLDLNVSKITGFNDGIPVTENKQVTSTIIIDNGQKVSFGGLEEVSEQKETQKLPFLGGLPFIGSFFSSSQNVKKKYDLTFEITAKVVN